MARAETLLVRNSDDNAAEVLRAVGDAPEFPKIRELLATIQTEKARYEKRQKLQTEMAVPLNCWGTTISSKRLKIWTGSGRSSPNPAARLPDFGHTHARSSRRSCGRALWPESRMR